MIKNIIYRLASGVLFMLTALFLCAATGLGVFFPNKDSRYHWIYYWFPIPNLII